MWASIGVVLLVVVAAGIGVVALSGGDDSGTAAPATSGAPVTTAAPLLDTGANVSTDLGRLPFRAAATKGNDIAVFSAPDAKAEPVTTLPKQTEYLLPRTLLAFDQYQDWLHVYLPTRPNNSTGWIKASDVNISNPLEWQIRVSLADHHLWLFRNGVVEYDTGVAIGTAQYPTPTGTYYFTDPVDLHTTPNPGTACSRSACPATPTSSPSSAVATARSRSTAPTTRATSARTSRTVVCASYNEAIERLSTLPLGTPVVIS